MLIKKLAYNIPTDDIIENLSCQVFHITHLQETCDKLEAENQALVTENAQLRKAVESFQSERGDLSAQVNELTNQLREAQSKTWVGRLLKRRD
jgi:chromosome segregation ATPase